MANQAVQKQQIQTVNQLMQRHMGQIRAALPKHMSAERMARIALTECRRVPKLNECNPVSLFGAVITAAQLGLEPGIAGLGYLIPFKNEVQFIPGYRGLMDLARRSGQVQSINAHVVYMNDPFKVVYGTGGYIEHEPTLDGDPGALRAAYTVAKLVGGDYQFEVMTRFDIEKIKAMSPGAKKADSPWNTESEPEMWRKTAVRRLCKYLPVSIELQHAVSLDEQASAGQAQSLGAVLEGETASPEPTEAEPESRTEALAAQMQDSKGKGNGQRVDLD